MHTQGTAIDHQFRIKFPPPFGLISQGDGAHQRVMQWHQNIFLYYQHVIKYIHTGTNPALIQLEID
jgi:hypothetical protein